MGIHPVPGQSRKFVYVYVCFFLSLMFSADFTGLLRVRTVRETPLVRGIPSNPDRSLQIAKIQSQRKEIQFEFPGIFDAYVLGHTPSTAGTFRKKFRKIPERPRKRSQSVSWNSPREYGWDAPNPIIQGICFQSVSRILSRCILNYYPINSKRFCGVILNLPRKEINSN